MNDSINRQDAIDTVHHSIFDFFDVVEDDEESPITEKDKMLLELNKVICNNIKELPSAQRKGKWIDMNTSTIMYMPRYKCSICNKCANKSNYCPNCGSKMMRGEEE